MQYIILSLIKILDNIILTLKSIYTYKNKKLLSSILVVISQLMFYIIIKEVISDDSITTILAVSFASGIGNYVAFLIADKFKKDDKWTMVLTSSCIEDIKELCDYLKNHKIKYVANDGYNRHGEKTINVIAFSKTKNESRLIEQYLKSTDTKYLKEII